MFNEKRQERGRKKEGRKQRSRGKTTLTNRYQLTDPGEMGEYHLEIKQQNTSKFEQCLSKHVYKVRANCCLISKHCFYSVGKIHNIDKPDILSYQSYYIHNTENVLPIPIPTRLHNTTTACFEQG